MKNYGKALMILFLFLLILSASVFGNPDIGDNYWPKEAWRTSTPEAQGMDSERIYRMLKFMKENLNIHSALIIRNGYLVTEAYFAPYHKDTRQKIYSCTKSFTSALIGIALREGLIKNIQQKVVDVFPEHTFANLDSRKKAMTIENLLSMTAGLEWLEPSPNEWRDRFYQKDVGPMIHSADPAQFVMDHPMSDEPGTRFYYNSGASHLLASIIHKTSGMTPLNFANEHLFKPLGISDFEWSADAKGTNWGGFDLVLTPAEMARFGYLYLRQGVWNGQQIIPAEWVATSTQEHIHYNITPTVTVPYGYQWWITPNGYTAAGWGGQYIYVIPKVNLVVVFTSGGAVLDQIVENYIISAVKSEKPLAPNPKIAKELQKLLQDIETPANKPAALPTNALKTAAQISGKTIQCAPNDFHVKALSLSFNPKNGCLLKVIWDDDSEYELPVGLDGVYRASEVKIDGEPQTIALKGTWQSGYSFLINYQILQHADRQDFLLNFAGDKVVIDCINTVNGPVGTIQGKLLE